MTLREALKFVDLDAVYDIIHRRDSTNEAKCDRPTTAAVVKNYGAVVKELLGKPKVKAYPMPIVVTAAVDPFDKTPFVDVYLRNRRYVKPPKGKEPWGGVRGKKVPAGKYNCNLSKYNLRYSLMGVRWSKLIDTQIENNDGYSNEQAIASILWELTFDGWTEAMSAKKNDWLQERLKESMQEVKDGKCVTLPPKNKGGLKVIIPDSVTKSIMDIINKPVTQLKTPNKCGTCNGWGLWAMGDASPMGPMDGSDGMPTRACPECGANPNPMK